MAVSSWLVLPSPMTSSMMYWVNRGKAKAQSRDITAHAIVVRASPLYGQR